MWKIKDTDDNERTIIMEDMRALNLKDLESVAGGAISDKMTNEEKTHYRMLAERYRDIGNEHLNGDATKAELDAAYQEMMDYHNEMEKKYY